MRKPLNPRERLHSQIRVQVRRSKETPASLSNAIHVEPSTIRHAIAEHRTEGRGVVSELTALLLGHHLGISPVYVAIARARDLLSFEEDRPGVPPEKQRRCREVREELDDCLDWSHAFRGRGLCRRLAFRHQRLQRDHTLASLAQQLGASIGEPPSKHERRLELYEAGRLAPASTELFAWWAQIAGTAQVALADADRIGARLLDIHLVRETAEQKRLRPCSSDACFRAASGPEMHWRPELGEALRWQVSPTVFGGISLDILDATLPQPVERSAVKLVNAFHPGFEISLLTRGRALITLSRTPFPAEDHDARPELSAEGADIAFHGCVKAGEIMAFPSHLYHRAEFLDQANQIVSINISRNIELARRYPYPKRPAAPT